MELSEEQRAISLDDLLETGIMLYNNNNYYNIIFLLVIDIVLVVQ